MKTYGQLRRARSVLFLLAAVSALLVAAPLPANAAGAAATGTWWKPKPGLSWQWQLTGTLDRTVRAQVYEIDGVDRTAADVKALHSAGRKVICYVNVGAYENWRPDKATFPSSVLGKNMDGWAGERWLDIRRWDELRPIMQARFEVCKKKGFDAVEADNVDGYTHKTGFPLTAADQLTYNRRIASLAHGLGLAAGLKNDLDQVAQLQPYFDFAVNEQCAQYNECGMLKPFIKAGKAVFHAEYGSGLSAFCPRTKPLGISSIAKKQDLGAWRKPCP